MFQVQTKEESDHNERLTELYKRCKFVLSDDAYFKKLNSYFTVNDILCIDTNSIDYKYDYSLKELKNFMQAVFIGVSHYCYHNCETNESACSIVDTTDTLFSWYDVKCSGVIYRFTEYEGDEVFGYKCEIVKNEVSDKTLNIEDINNYYQNFNPKKPHEKVRSRK